MYTIVISIVGVKRRMNLVNYRPVRTRTPLACGYVCVHGVACMYIGNTLVRLHIVARNSDADVIL